MQEVTPKKSLGQHWLFDDASLEAMCDAVNVSRGDVILEIGPGTGALTKKLLDRGAIVEAVELDGSLAKRLQQQFFGLPFKLNLLSILDFDFNKMPKNYKIVANIPYYLTSHLLRVISESSNPPAFAALLVQKEVAQRVVSDPGDMSILSVSVQLYFNASLGALVPAKLFTPPPKVDSQILILELRDKPMFDNLDFKKYFRVVKGGYAGKRKKLRSSLSGGLGITKTQADELLDRSGIDGNLRAQNLSLEDWHKIYLNFND